MITRPPTVDAAAATNQWHLLVALGIGLLIGLERERRKGAGRTREAAGVRTFALVALLGGLAAELGGVAVLAVCAAFIAAAGLVAYAHRRDDDPGLTTQVALMTTFLIGALTARNVVLAAGVGVVVAVLLAARTPLHRFVRDSLSEQEFDRLRRRAGLPPPIRQSVRVDASGRRRYIDADFGAFSVEIDGGFHLRPLNYWADARRQNELVLGGDRILRFPSVAIRLEPEVVVAQLRAAGIAFGLIKPPAK